MNLGQLTTESRNPASENLDCLSAMEIVHLMNAEDAQVAPAVRQVADAVAAAIDVIADRLRRGGRLVYIGAGTSGRLAVLDAAECPPTFNSPPWQVLAVIAGGPAALTRAVEGAEDHPQKAKEDLQHIDLCASDVLVGIATSGRTPYVVGGIAYARSIGTYTIGLSCNDSPQLSAAADLTITPVVGPEVISGSTRLKAGTATKLVLNMLTTGAMVRLGKTYGNLMVDLQATNQKLADRSRRIVSLLTGSSPEQAAELLDRCHGDLKTAVVVQRQGIEPHEAAELLRGSGGQLRPALTDPPPVGMPRRIGTANSLVLGVDGGGSATRAWLAPAVEGPPLGIGQAGAANPHCAGWAAAIGNIDRAIELAFRQAGMNRQPVTAACLAVAGVGSESDQRRLELWAKTRAIADDLQVTHDGRSLLAAGAADGCGIALVSGTGSFAFGCNARGQTARSGGWGHLFGDEGSGYDVARRGLRAVSLAVDGRGPQTLLERELCDAVGQNQAEGMLRHVQGRGGDRQWIASLARCIVRAAEADDVVALGILDCAADALAKMVDAIRNRLGFQRYTLVLGGGLLANAEVLREKIADQLQATGSGAHDTHVVKQPVEGAVRLARQAAGCRE